jgi:hypothetical protein
MKKKMKSIEQITFQNGFCLNLVIIVDKKKNEHRKRITKKFVN